MKHNGPPDPVSEAASPMWHPRGVTVTRVHNAAMASMTVHGGEWVKVSPMSSKHKVDYRCDRCFRAAASPKMVSVQTNETLCIPCWAHRLGPELYSEVTGNRTLPKAPKEYRHADGSLPSLNETRRSMLNIEHRQLKAR
jgi:hypothetical protein